MGRSLRALGLLHPKPCIILQGTQSLRIHDGQLHFPLTSEVLGSQKSKPLLSEEQQHVVSVQGCSRDEVEKYASEADIYLEVDPI